MTKQASKSAVCKPARLIITALILIAVLPVSAGNSYRYRHAIDDPLKRQQSHIYEIYGQFAVRGPKVHISSLRKMFNTGVRRLTGLDDASKAWRRFIHDDDIVALKFTNLGSMELGSNREVAAALLQTLYDVGFKPKNFMVVGLDQLPDEAQGTIPCRYGWQQELADFGSDTDNLAGWLNEVTAIINIPLVMDDNIIGLRCAMANLTWPLLKRPARLYGSHGDPFITEVYSLPQIRGKVRLHIANCLRILYHGGPQIDNSYIHQYGAFIFGTDPVALDRVALELIQRQRREKPMPKNVKEKIYAPYLQTAQSFGLGYNDLNFIEYHKMPHDKKE